MKKRPGLAHFIENMCCNFKGNPKAKKCYSIHWARREMKNVRQTDCFWMNEFGFDFRMPFSITMRPSACLFVCLLRPESLKPETPNRSAAQRI